MTLVDQPRTDVVSYSLRVRTCVRSWGADYAFRPLSNCQRRGEAEFSSRTLSDGEVAHVTVYEIGGPMQSALAVLRDRLVALYPPEFQSPLQEALPQIRLQALRLGAEVLDVEQRRLAYSAAVHRPGEWPLMARVHHGLLDVLQHELPKPLLQVINCVVDRVRAAPDLEHVGRALFCSAALGQGTVEGSLLRFLLYQGVRLNLWFLTWTRPELEAVGALRQLDDEAQTVLEKGFAAADMYDEEVRPLTTIIAELLVKAELWSASEMRRLQSSSMAYFQALIEHVRTMSAPDAAVLRNDYGPRDEHLESQLLAERHPHLFASRDAVDQRRHRLLKKLRDGQDVAAKGVRLVDLLQDLLRGELDELEGGRHA